MRLLQGLILTAIVLDAALVMTSTSVRTTSAQETVGMSSENESPISPTTVLVASR